MEKNVPEDITMDILVRLPAKSLIRFKCISKSCYSLISDPYFIKLHPQYSNSHQKFVEQNSPLDFDLISREYTQIALPFNNINHHYPEICKLDIKCSCDGLLLLACYYGARDQHFIVWNPLTRESRELPKVDGIVDYNLGYDSSTNDYNVIIDIYSHPGFGFSLQRDLMVFSLKKSSSWRRIKDFNHDIKLKKCINLNGALYWLPRPDKDKILCFSVAEETIMEMELPKNKIDCSPGVLVGLKLSIWQGCLCLSKTISLHPDHHSVSLNVWLMKENGSWTKFITIPKLPLIDPLRRIISAPYYSMKKAVFIIKEEWNSTFVMYDLEEKEFEIIDCKTYQHFKKGLTFVESLVSPNCN